MSPEVEEMLTMEALGSRPAFDSARQCPTKARVGANVALSCPSITVSHSSSDMLANMRSRRAPALFTSPSTLPKVSTAVASSSSAPASVRTSAAEAAAFPRGAVIAWATSWAKLGSTPSPESSAPMSLTTTAAPSAAANNAWARPSPRPAPVMTTTRPASAFMSDPLCVEAGRRLCLAQPLQCFVGFRDDAVDEFLHRGHVVDHADHLARSHDPDVGGPLQESRAVEHGGVRRRGDPTPRHPWRPLHRQAVAGESRT